MRWFGALLLIVSSAIAEDPLALVSIREPVRAFFGKARNEPLPTALAGLAVPPLHKLPFVRTERKYEQYAGWRWGNQVFVGLYDLRKAHDETRPFDRKLLELKKTSVGFLLADFIAALQAGDEERAQVAWDAIQSRNDPKGAIAESLRRQWPRTAFDANHAGLFGACMHAIETVGGDDLHARFAERRRIYVRACQQKIPCLPTAAVPTEKRTRMLIEGLRRVQPLWSCFAGHPPSFRGKPDAYAPLQHLGIAALPELAIAVADPRDAGRPIRLGGEGDPSSVGFIAENLVREILRYECSEDLLERWVQSGTWNDKRLAPAWMIDHADEPQALVFNLLHSDEAPVDMGNITALLRHEDPAVRLAAAARLREPDVLRRTAGAARKANATYDNWYYFHPSSKALQAWILAFGERCRAPEKSFQVLLKAAPEDKRSAMLDTIGWIHHDGIKGTDTKRAPLARLCAGYLDDTSENVRSSAAWAYLNLIREARPDDYQNWKRLIAKARKLARERGHIK